MISSVLPFAFPGSVISMLLVLLFLSLNLLKESYFGETSAFFLKNMIFFFIPPAIGILRYADLVKSIWWQLILVNVISLFACFIASSWTVILVSKLQQKLRGRRHG